MFKVISKKKLMSFIKMIKTENRKENLYAKYPPKDKKQENLNCYSQGYEDGTDNMFNAICGKFKLR